MHGEMRLETAWTMAFLIFCGAGPTQASEKGFHRRRNGPDGTMQGEASR
jgi:hypothetical protein